MPKIQIYGVIKGYGVLKGTYSSRSHLASFLDDFRLKNERFIVDFESGLVLRCNLDNGKDVQFVGKVFVLHKQKKARKEEITYYKEGKRIEQASYSSFPRFISIYIY